MDGVTILSVEYVNFYGAGWFALIVAVATTIFTLACVACMIRERDISPLGTTALLAISAIALWCFSYELLTSGYDKYIVTIDDSVSVVEFYDKYKVIEHTGDLWMIRER